MSEGGDQGGIQDIAPSNTRRAPGWQPQPLERGQFEHVLKAFFQQRHFVIDPTAPVIDSRQVDLYLLHRAVFEMGGFCKVEATNAWDIIGGKLGFVNFPGSDGQPPRSGPGISLQIAQYYKDYLQAFDAAYLRTMLESRIKVATGQQELTEAYRNQALVMVKNFTGFDCARVQHPQKMSEQQMSQLVSFAHCTAAELRSMNVPDNIIQIVEARRSDLQRLYQDQVDFKGMVAQNGGNTTRSGQPQSLMQNGGQFYTAILNPTKEETQSVLVNLAKLRREATEVLPHLQPVEIPPDQRAAYNSLLESVHQMTLDFDPKLPILYSLIKNDDHIRRIVKITSTVQFQRTLCSQSNPRIIISLDALRASQLELVRLNDAFTLAMKQAHAMQQNQQGHSQSQESSLQTAIRNYVTTHSAQQQGLNKNQLVQASGSAHETDSEVDPLIEALSSLSLP